jgi:hypothetical protein
MGALLILNPALVNIHQSDDTTTYGEITFSDGTKSDKFYSVAGAKRIIHEALRDKKLTEYEWYEICAGIHQQGLDDDEPVLMDRVLIVREVRPSDSQLVDDEKPEKPRILH